jgi:hypothetical protein
MAVCLTGLTKHEAQDGLAVYSVNPIHDQFGRNLIQFQ